MCEKHRFEKICPNISLVLFCLIQKSVNNHIQRHLWWRFHSNLQSDLQCPFSKCYLYCRCSQNMSFPHAYIWTQVHTHVHTTCACTHLQNPNSFILHSVHTTHYWDANYLAIKRVSDWDSSTGIHYLSDSRKSRKSAHMRRVESPKKNLKQKCLVP